MVFDKPILIEKKNIVTKQWEPAFNVHASVNKSGGSEYLNGGAIQSRSNLVFEVRYFPDLEDIDARRAFYRIIYRGRTFNIKDYDDFYEQHKTVKLLGESYG